MARSNGVSSTPAVASSFTSRSQVTRPPWANGIGLGPGAAGLGAGRGKRGPGQKRFKKVLRDNLKGVTKGDIRRLARRGGVKRISHMIYDSTRDALKQRLELILKDLIAIADFRKMKTITVQDVVFVLRRLGTPLVGFGDTHLQRPDPIRPKRAVPSAAHGA